jgi:hypothetical protein
MHKHVQVCGLGESSGGEELGKKTRVPEEGRTLGTAAILKALCTAGGDTELPAEPLTTPVTSVAGRVLGMSVGPAWLSATRVPAALLSGTKVSPGEASMSKSTDAAGLSAQG